MLAVINITLTDIPLPLLLAGVFVLSLLIGSFLSVVIIRLPVMMRQQWLAEAREILDLPAEKQPALTLAMPSSHCQTCQHALRWWENIPVISYVLLRAQCRHCGVRITPLYPLVECLTACLATGVFWHFSRFGLMPQAICAVFFVFALIALSGIDIATHLLPDVITLTLMWAGIVLSFYQVFIPLEVAVIGAVIGYILLWSLAMLCRLLYKKDGLGLGDAKLLAAILAWVDVQYVAIVLFVACVTGLLVTVVLRVARGQLLRDNPLPFGPYLAFSGVLVLLFGDHIAHAMW